MAYTIKDKVRQDMALDLFKEKSVKTWLGFYVQSVEDMVKTV
jgi:hypothetical protein